MLFVALALALAARREIVSSARSAREGRWGDRDHFSGEALAGSRVTVVGLGAIGERTRSLMVALGAKVTAWSRSPRAVDGFETDLDRALTGADNYYSCHIFLWLLKVRRAFYRSNRFTGTIERKIIATHHILAL